MTREHRTLREELAALADQLEWPEGDMAPRVRRRIVGAPSSDRTLRWKVAVAALLAAAVTFAVPAGRRAVADLLGVVGIEVTFADAVPATDTAPPDLGRPVSPERATDRIGFPLALPTGVEIGPPDALHLQEGPAMVHATWGADPDHPAVPGTNIGLLLTQFRVSDDQTVLSKRLGDGTGVEVTTVGDQEARWIEGAPHRLIHRKAGGSDPDVISRLAANVLVWEKDGITYRLESTLGLESSRRIAEAVAPVSP